MASLSIVVDMDNIHRLTAVSPVQYVHCFRQHLWTDTKLNLLSLTMQPTGHLLQSVVDDNIYFVLPCYLDTR